MFDSNLTVNDGSVDRVYNLRSIVDGKSIRADASATLGEPRLLTISHGKRNPKDPESPDRHLVRVDLVDHDADGKPHTASAYIVLENPVNGLFSTAVMKNLFTTVYNTIHPGGASFDRFLNNEP
jgi:hypothetical protein